MAHRLRGIQAQGARRLVLAAGDGLHAGTDDLGHVGAGEQRQRRHASELAGEVQHGADEEVEDEYLHQQRRTAHQLDVEGREVVQGRILRQAAETGEQADEQAERAGNKGDPQRGPQAPGERAGGPVAGRANYITLGDVVVFGELQAVRRNGQHLLLAIFVHQRDAGIAALRLDLLHPRDAVRTQRFFSLIGEVLRDAVPAPLVGDQRSGVPDGQADQQKDQTGQPMPGPGCAFRSSHESLP